MNRIERRFAELREKGETAFIPFITAGDPTLDQTEELVLALADAGADIIELGVPFSDPLADGVVNQEAAQRALLHHVTLHDIVALIGRLRKRTEVPLMLFTYYNPVLAYGAEALATEAAEAGADGILCVDLPPEEAESYRTAMAAKGLSTVFLLAPTSTDERIRRIAEASTGFIYYVSRTGVTGEQLKIEDSVRGMVKKIKQHSDMPVAVGFGISNPEQAAEVAGMADGVVVGSAIVRMIGELGDTPETARKVGEFVATLASATKGKA
ncbi:MAG: tryptophan synthase subunit alpha [Candidatus Hydrogenedentes bacterium]|nr:tryptophan synthase subunit alpha [Candidatus Hydrogenedentota bacterium]